MKEASKVRVEPTARFTETIRTAILDERKALKAEDPFDDTDREQPFTPSAFTVLSTPPKSPSNGNGRRVGLGFDADEIDFFTPVAFRVFAQDEAMNERARLRIVKADAD